jgi:hypothetical protein
MGWLFSMGYFDILTHHGFSIVVALDEENGMK